MAKKRVHEVAKELGVPTKELIDSLADLGIEKKSNLSALDEDEIALLHDHFNGSSGQAKATSPEPAASSSAAKESTAESTTAVAEPEPKEEPKAEVETKVSDEELERQLEAELEAEISREEEQQTAQKAPAESEAKPTATKPEKPKGTTPRPPVVAVLGHVDHGKTSLLDKIRKSDVAGGEAGGITQAIGAYQVDYNGHKITFIDTPGHRAFTGMRARGAQVTDIVILVVAADDGIMDQTKEAIAHAKAAGVPIIVAINKIDKPGADPVRVKQQLSDADLMPEEWGGQTITVDLSAVTGEGVEDLLEMILLVAEVEEYKANPEDPAEGIVIESYMDHARGAVATAIIQNGTLHERDIVVAGPAYGRIKALQDHRGERLDAATPGTPIQILGLSEAPPVGGLLTVADNPSKARKMAELRKQEERQTKLSKPKLTWDQLMAKAEQKGVLKLILKADSLGSLEALQNEVQLLDTDEISLEILHTAVGNIGESDVLLAASTDDEVIIFGFQVEMDNKAKELADQEGITVRTYEIIYQLMDDLKKAHISLMEPQYKEVQLGVVEIRQVFTFSKVGSIAGCFVRDGLVKRNSRVKVMRGEKELFDGRIESLKRFEQDVREVTKEKECGIKVEGFNDIEVGDTLLVYQLEEIERF